MTPDEIIALAKRVGFPIHHPEWRKAVEEFAALVEDQTTAIEREACAELRNKLHAFDGKGRQEIIDVMNTALNEYQAAIRARG